MRIAHVVTYVSADGAFGGPLAVLAEQTAELARRGHQVEVFAGWDGVGEFAPAGVEVHLFRTRRLAPAGFSGLVAPGLLRTLRRRRQEFDVLHVHLARDLITTPTAFALRGSVPRLFLQPHGMVTPDRRVRARALDLLVRRVLAAAAGTFALTDVDAARLRGVEPSTRILDLPNGVTLPPPPRTTSRRRLEVLFLARLQPRKRVLLFAEAARDLLEDDVDADFVVVGPDEGDLPELTARIQAWDLGGRLRYEGAVPPGAGRQRISRADIYVLPSVNEPFPMSVLEALSVGVPTVISRTCHIADRLEGAAAVFDEDGDRTAQHLADSVGALLREDGRRRDLGRRGRAAVESSFSIARVVDLLDEYYGGVAPGGREGGRSKGEGA